MNIKLNNEKSPLVSILAPMYNAKNFIEVCIDSVLRQTLKDIELILIDDHSTDGSFEIVLEKYLNPANSTYDPRVKLYRNDFNHHGFLVSNFLIKQARGKYIYFMDHDDAIFPQTLEIFYNAAEESQAEVVHMNSYLMTFDEDFSLDSTINGTIQHIPNPTPRFLDEDLPQRLHDEFVHYGCEVVPWIKIQRRDFLLNYKIGFPTTTREPDTLIHLAQLCFAKKIQIIDGLVGVHRLHRNSLMHSSNENHFREAIKSLSQATEYLNWIFSSNRLISPLPSISKILTEAHMIRHFFELFILPSYRGELNPKQINDILQEIVPNPEKRLMIHTLATYLIQLDLARKH